MIFSSSFVAVTTVAAAAAIAPLAASETVLEQPEAYQQRLVDWIRSGENGFFHSQVQWERLGGTGPYAMHAKVDIPKGEKLMVVPRSHVIDSLKTHDECVTIARMLDEYEKGDGSFFAPYLSYLFDDTTGGTTSGLLPGSWSGEGQELLRQVLGHTEQSGLSPRDFAKPSVFEECGENFRAERSNMKLDDEEDRQRAEDAHLFLISRSWTDKMVPVLDMCNHGNGKSLNVESTSVHDTEQDITAYALRDIKAGEQLQNTYNECMDHDCDFGEMKYSYDTSMMFNDYGFLEFYPRRWPLRPDGQGSLIAEVDEDLETGAKSFRWIFEKPSETTLEWMSLQLNRLKTMESAFRKSVAAHRTSGAGGSHNNIPHEADSLLEMFDGYVEVLEMALEHKGDALGVSFQDFEEELDQMRHRVTHLDEEEL